MVTAIQGITRYVDLPPLWTLAFMAMAAMLSSVHAPYGDAVRTFGAITMVLSVLTMVWAVYHLCRADTAVMPGAEPRALVRLGPFRYSRNPIYVADVALLIGFALFCGQPVGAFLAIPLMAILTTRFIQPEERALTRRFDAMYLAYKAEIPRWL